jgi:hypothetical protein
MLAPKETADNPGGLMPMAPVLDAVELSQYSAEAKYQAGGSVGQLWSVPIRATLKQFQGYWAGNLSGKLDASLKRKAAGSTQLTLDSWMENKLDTDLAECYLIVTNQDVAEEKEGSARTASRSNRTMVYELGTLPRGKRLTWKGITLDYLRRKEKERVARGEQAEEIDETNPEMPPVLLSLKHNDWVRGGYNLRLDPYGTRESELRQASKSSLYAALLVMSTFAELNLDRSTTWGNELQRTRGFDLDRSEALTSRTALLVGFAEGSPGPARLALRAAGGTASQWETVEPADANTMYRFVIPLSSP